MIQDTLEFKVTKPMQSFYHDSHLKIEEDKWLLSLTNLEVYNSVFIKTEENHTF